MPWLISVLGAVLGLAGAWSLWNGISFIRLDWGQTETVAGTVALSAGIVTLGIGAVLFALRDLRTGFAPAMTTDTTLDPDLAATPALAPSERTTSAASRLKSRLATVGMPKNQPSEPAGSPPVIDAPVVRTGLPSAPEVRPAVVAEIAPPSEERSVPSVSEAPTVVGRYDANGATYVLFSDGTIEVETGSGTHRFASMADLKDHIERQDGT